MKELTSVTVQLTEDELRWLDDHTSRFALHGECVRIITKLSDAAPAALPYRFEAWDVIAGPEGMWKFRTGFAYDDVVPCIYTDKRGLPHPRKTPFALRVDTIEENVNEGYWSLALREEEI